MLRRTRFRPDLTKAAGGVNKSWKGVIDLAGAVDYSNLPVKWVFYFSSGLRLVCAAGGEHNFLERVCYVEEDA